MRMGIIFQLAVGELHIRREGLYIYIPLLSSETSDSSTYAYFVK